MFDYVEMGPSKVDLVLYHFEGCLHLDWLTPQLLIAYVTSVLITYHPPLRKSVRIRSYSGPHFPLFLLNTERYGVSLCIQSKRGKIRTRIALNTDTYHAVPCATKKSMSRNSHTTVEFSQNLEQGLRNQVTKQLVNCELQTLITGYLIEDGTKWNHLKPTKITWNHLKTRIIIIKPPKTTYP